MKKPGSPPRRVDHGSAGLDVLLASLEMAMKRNPRQDHRTVLIDFGVGPERAQNMVPFGNVVKNGISLSLHSDMPMAPAKPLALVWAAVNRVTAEGKVAGHGHAD